jgi:RNA polymerase sigma factor (sigma-70 family)
MTDVNATGAAGGEAFGATRWTLVLRAQGGTPEARTALGELCDAYYRPVLRFLRREGRTDDAARELAQEFFARFLARGGIGAANPQRGRFRSYLLGAVKHFLADQRDHAMRVKRGSGVTPESFDAAATHSPALQVADLSGLPDDALFDREWALALMERTLNCVAGELAREGKSEQFAALKPWLAGDAETLPQAEAAQRLGMTESAVKVAIHRLRKRFRERVRAEIAQTVDTSDDIDSELRYLIKVLAHG